MIVEAVLVERANNIEVRSPKYSRGKPIHIINKKHSDKKVKLVTGFSDVLMDKPNCKCSHHKCGVTQYTNEYLKKQKLPRNTFISCGCCNTIYIVVPKIFI